jgi:hypothetical protein
MNHAALQAALDRHPPAVMPTGMFRLPEDPLMLDSSIGIGLFDDVACDRTMRT